LQKRPIILSILLTEATTYPIFMPLDCYKLYVHAITTLSAWHIKMSEVCGVPNLQHTAAHCNNCSRHVSYESVGIYVTLALHDIRSVVSHPAAKWCLILDFRASQSATRCHTLQHTATHCNTLQHTCGTLKCQNLHGISTTLYSV